jgi:cystathionine beta-lyase
VPYNFDSIIDRHATNCVKWRHYPQDVLPLWVADMDFPAPPAVRAALATALERGIFGYDQLSPALRETVTARMERLYAWKVAPEAVVATPGVIAGFTAAAHAACQPGQGVLIQPPVYPPFHAVHQGAGLMLQQAAQVCQRQGARLAYAIDWERLQAAVDADGAKTGMFLLCNPHNPTGQVFGREELFRIADICARHEITLCSDEIHSELLLADSRHLAVAALDPTIAARTITLIAPSKTFNIPGLFCAFAIIPDETLRSRYLLAQNRLAMHVNSLGLVAAQAAFSGDCDDWLADLRRYLTANRDLLTTTLEQEMPELAATMPAATYLAWIDCRDLLRSGRLVGSPARFFLKEAQVALQDGAEFGSEGQGFVRLNFGCPRHTLQQALDRMKAALH